MSQLSQQSQSQQLSIMATAFEAAISQQLATNQEITNLLKGNIMETQTNQSNTDQQQDQNQQELNQLLNESVVQYFTNAVITNKPMKALLDFVKQFTGSEEFTFFMKLPDDMKQTIMEKVFESLGLMEIITQFKANNLEQQVSLSGEEFPVKENQELEEVIVKVNQFFYQNLYDLGLAPTNKVPKSH